MANDNDILLFGSTNFRNEERKFGIKIRDRRQHMYILGKSGTGKSTLLSNMAISDIVAGRGVCIIDPHGEFAEDAVRMIPEQRVDDVIYIDPSDTAFPIAFNPLERVDFELRHLVASGIMSVFKKIWPDVWSARMEYILNNTLLALLEYPNSTLLGIMKMFSDKEYRKGIVENLQDPVVRSFWVDEYSKYSQKFETEAVAAIQNKIGQFVSNPLIRNIIGQVHSSFDVRKVMDEGKILIVNLSKGKIGEDNSALLGAMLITKIQLAAMSRVNIPMEERRDFYLYVDEFQNFATESFANILSEARKYRLSLVLAHQYIEQLDDTVRAAIFGNVGTMIVFRVGAIDGEALEKEFAPSFLANDFVNLPNFNIYVNLMIDGVSSKPFSARTLPPLHLPSVSLFDTILQASREKYALPRAKVEEKIASEYINASATTVSETVLRKNERSLDEALRPRNGGGQRHENTSHDKKAPAEPSDVVSLQEIIRQALSHKSSEGEQSKNSEEKEDENNP